MMRRFLCTLSAAWLMSAVVVTLASAQPINVRLAPYNAWGDGSHDDTGAFLAAIAAVPATGGEVYVPAGRYKLTQTLSVSGKPIAFRGEGQGISHLIWYGVWDGLSFTSTHPSQHQTLTVKSLSLLRGDSSGGAGIVATWPVLTSPMSFVNGGGVTATIDDVQVGVNNWPNTGGSHWHFGIQLFNATNAKITQFSIQSGGIAGIQIAGNPAPPGGGRSVGVQIRDGDITSVVRGVEAKDLAEAVEVNNVVVRDSVFGVMLTTSTGQSTTVANCLIYASIYGVFAQNTSGVAITNNVIHRFGAEHFAGIVLTEDRTPGGRAHRVSGNAVYSPTQTQVLTGIWVGGNVMDSVIHGNTTVNMSYGIYLTTPTVTGTQVLANLNRFFTAAAIANAGTGNNVAHNW